MKITLYGLATCSRCKTAKMMLEKRNLEFEYLDPKEDMEYEKLPILKIDGKQYSAKDSLMQIRKLEVDSNGGKK